MASPGRMDTQAAERIPTRPSFTMRPMPALEQTLQAQEAEARFNQDRGPTIRENMTRTGLTTFGRMCRAMTRRSVAPAARQPRHTRLFLSQYLGAGQSRESRRTADPDRDHGVRGDGQNRHDENRDHVHGEGKQNVDHPHHDGIDYSPEVPAQMPRTRPMAPPRATADSETLSENRAPHTIRLNVSLPS